MSGLRPDIPLSKRTGTLSDLEKDSPTGSVYSTSSTSTNSSGVRGRGGKKTIKKRSKRSVHKKTYKRRNKNQS